MMKLFTNGHRSDEDLLSYLDGEVPLHKGWMIRRHLGLCWKCRARASELEAEVHFITGLIEADTFPGGDRVASARTRLAGRLWTLSAQTRPSPAPKHGRLMLLAAAACVGAIVFFTIPRRSTPPPPPQAHALLAEVARSEQAAVTSLSSKGLVHQSFRVVTCQTKPARARRESRLEVWADASKGRFTSRWQDPAGTLKHALWRPERGRSYSYANDGPRSVRVVRTAPSDYPIPDLVQGSLSLDSLEHAFLLWLEARPWTTVALSDGMRRFVSTDGATLVAETIQEEGSAPRLRLRATRSIPGGKVMFDLLSDGRTRRPKLQQVTWERYGQVFELQLIAEEERSVVRASFEPDRNLLPRRVPEKLLPPEPVKSVEPKENLLSLQVQAMYALHKLNVCLGEGVELTREGESVVVRGVVGTEERKQQITTALALLAQSHPLRIQIESANEAVARMADESAIASGTTLTSARPAADPKSPSKHPWCKGKTVKACAQARAKVLAAAELLVAESAELRNLETLRVADSASADSGQLIETMFQSHSEGLRAKTAEFWQLLGQLAPDAGWVAQPVPVEGKAADCVQVYDAARNLSRNLQQVLREDATGAGTWSAHQAVVHVSTFQALLDAAVRPLASRAVQ